MKEYQCDFKLTIKAKQFVEFNKKDKQIQLCEMFAQKITPLPRDLMSSPRDAFYGLETQDGWVKIELNDWIVEKNNELLVISNQLFKLLFSEKQQ